MIHNRGEVWGRGSKKKTVIPSPRMDRRMYREGI